MSPCSVLLWMGALLSMPGDATIRGGSPDSQITIRTSARFAGAIESFVWNGKEFIDRADHGRQLQSAANFDLGKPFTPETFNPTEAGSRVDGDGPTSSSKLLSIRATKNVLETESVMAFWLKPGERSHGRLALNGRVLSNHRLHKRVTIGVPGHANVIEYVVTFTVPKGERHRYAQFEAVTGYMPPEFSQFFVLTKDGKRLESISDGPGEQSRPIIFSTPSGSHAMGVYSPDQPSAGYVTSGYGRFRFVPEKVVKWNCVFRVRNVTGIKPGEYRFRSFIAVGQRDHVRKALAALRMQNTEKSGEKLRSTSRKPSS